MAAKPPDAAAVASGARKSARPGGAVVRRAGQVATGQPIDVQLAEGRLAARVEEVLDERS